MRISGNSHTPIHLPTHTPTNLPDLFLFAEGVSAGRNEEPARFGAPFSLSISEFSFLPSTGVRRSNRAPICNKHNIPNVAGAAGGARKPLSPGETLRPLPPRKKQAGASFVTNSIPNSHLDSTPKTDVDVSLRSVGAPAHAFGVGDDDWDGHGMTLAGWCAVAGLYAMDIAGVVWGLFKRKKCKKS